MPLSGPSPYEILGVDSTAGSAELKAAQARAIRERKHRPNEVAQAAAQLRNPEKRLEWDLLEHLPPQTTEGLDAAFAPVAAEQPLPEPDPFAMPPASALLVLREQDLLAEWSELPPEAGVEALRVPAPYRAGTAVLPPVEIPE
ncbi:hypothetical protein [Streptacidiphilus carbonis]|jgi:hypothetical protein|uniref:hypothetical protein n=1 Tax=Streptacidiphilus carbonis TaxID=105422 RepID=UPI0005A68515|nr:hypothetical protein [Streptacidiphilus carbonis]